MKKALFAISLLAGVAAFAASADAGQVKSNAGIRGVHYSSTAPKKAFTTKAKVAYSYARGIGIDRVKNVSDFQHPSVGIYCILPSVPVDTTQDHPDVSIEWDNSLGFGLLAYWQDTDEFSDCPSGYSEVKTYAFDDGLALSDQVAFDWKLQ